MLNYQATSIGLDTIDLKNDKIIYYSVDDKSEVESLDCICVTQNHQINLPDSNNSNEHVGSEEVNQQFSINEIEIMSKKKYEPSDLSEKSVRSVHDEPTINIAQYMDTPPKITRTNKIGLTCGICKNPDNNNTGTIESSPVKDLKKLSSRPDQAYKGVRVETKSSLTIDNVCKLIEPDLKKFYENKHRFKKEEFQHFVDLGKRDSYFDFIRGN